MVGTDKIGGGRNEEIQAPSAKGFSGPKANQAPKETSAKAPKPGEDIFVSSPPDRATPKDVTDDVNKWAKRGLSDAAANLLANLSVDRILKLDGKAPKNKT